MALEYVAQELSSLMKLYSRKNIFLIRVRALRVLYTCLAVGIPENITKKI